MACLDTTSKSLTIELTGSPTTQAQWTVHYATRSGTDFAESSNDGVTNSTTPVTMIASPGSGETISIRDITVYNADVSSVTIVIKLVNGGNSRVLYRQVLDTLESWSSLAQKGKDGAQGLTGSVSAASGLILDESSAPNTATSQGALYVPSSDNLLRYRGESNGAERRIALIDTTNLATNDLFYYGSDGLFKRIAIGTVGQTLIAQPESTPPYQFSTPSDSREVLSTNKTVWVKSDKTYSEANQTGGNDTTGDGTEGNPWLTISKLSDYIATVDLNGYTLTCNLNGSFGTEGSAFTWKMPIGSGSLIIKDSAGNKNNTKLKGSFRSQAATIPLVFEQVTFQESISNNGAVDAQRGCHIILKNCRVRSGYVVLWASFGGQLQVQGELIFRNFRQAPGDTNLSSLFYGQYAGILNVSSATIRTVTDDNDTTGSLSFLDKLFQVETLALVYAGVATFAGTAYGCSTTNWLKSQRLANWTYA